MYPEDELLYRLAHAAQERAVRRRRKAAARTGGLARQAAAPRRSPTQQSGDLAEKQARHHLEAAGLTVLDTQLARRTGEIDLVCRDGEVLVFVEVRGRASSAYGGAAASVNRAKQQRLMRTAQILLPILARAHFHGRTPACRFDVVSVERGRVHWFQHAFSVR